MVAVTVALAYYAYTTIEEGKKGHRADPIERQLELFYNPMIEIMEKADLWTAAYDAGSST